MQILAAIRIILTRTVIFQIMRTAFFHTDLEKYVYDAALKCLTRLLKRLQLLVRVKFLFGGGVCGNACWAHARQDKNYQQWAGAAWQEADSRYKMQQAQNKYWRGRARSTSATKHTVLALRFYTKLDDGPAIFLIFFLFRF